MVVDQAHQHFIPADLLLNLLEGLVKERNDLKVVVMPATIDANLFTDNFPGSRLETVSGREYKVLVNYLE